MKQKLLPTGTFCLTFVLAFLAIGSQAEEPDITNGKLLREHDFSTTELGKEFIVKRGQWKVEDGALSAREIESEHHAGSCHLMQETTDAVFEFRFKSADDTSKINVGFDPAPGELDKVGHIHAVTISSRVVILAMAGDKKKPDENPGGKLGSARVNLEKDTWYQVQLINQGDECRLSIDGETLIVGKHPEIAVKKPSIIFRAFGEGIAIDDIKIAAVKTPRANKPAKRTAAISAGSRPNIVFMMSDDHKATAMGCMGNQEIETPNLDQLAGQGVVFERCYATSPLCNPSRVTSMTGMYEYKTGANFSVGSISSVFWNEFSYPMLLKKAGYQTAFAGKWGFSLEDTDYDYIGDFDAWGGFERGLQGSYVTEENESLRGYTQEYPHVSRALGAFGSDFIEEAAESGEPFCLSISFKTPHSPHNVIDPLDQGRYEGVTFPEPPSFGQAGVDRLPTQAKLGRQYLLRRGWSGDAYQVSLRRYYQLISGMDAGIGMVMQALEDAGVADNTVVIYTSDNGYHCGEHGLQGKMLPYDSSARIPLIVYDPRSPSQGKNLRNSSVVGNIDFASTILDLAGLEAPAKMDGVSLRPLIDDPSGRVRDTMLVVQNWGWMVNDHNRALAVVSEDWKYINWCYADENVPPTEELFHLKEDPSEMSNVVGNPEHSETLAAYQETYDQYHESWVSECVETEQYTRMGRIFDRHLPWQEKDFQVDGTPGGRAEKKKWPDFLEIYQELTGKEFEAK